MKTILADTTYSEETSTWIVPLRGTPVYVPDGVIKPSHFAGMPYLRTVQKGSEYRDSLFKSDRTKLYGTMGIDDRKPCVVEPWASVPLTPDGKGVWPNPAFRATDVTVKAVLRAYGDFPSFVLAATRCNGRVDLYLEGTCGWLWPMQAMVSLEDCPNLAVYVHTGVCKATTVVRALGCPGASLYVAQDVVSHGQTADTGLVHRNPRYTASDGSRKWAPVGGKVNVQGRFEQDAFGALVRQMSPQMPFCSVHLDDWEQGCEVETSGRVVVGGGSGHKISASETILEVRDGWVEPTMPGSFKRLKDTEIVRGSVKVA